MFGLKKRKEKKEQKKERKLEKRVNKQIKGMDKKREKAEDKVIKKISKQLSKNESIEGIVAYASAERFMPGGYYIVRTSEDRFFVGGLQRGKLVETVITKDKILNISKSGIMPTSINLELVNGNITLFVEPKVVKADKLYIDALELIRD